MPRKTSRTAASDYEAKISSEISQLARRTDRPGPPPFGDPLSGIILVAEPAPERDTETNTRMADALHRSLSTLKLDRAYVTWTHPYLLEEVLSLEPSALVAVGPDAASAIDALDYPLVKTPFSEATEGSPFAWTDGASGLLLPALATALTDDDAKRRFWRAFLAMRAFAARGE